MGGSIIPTGIACRGVFEAHVTVAGADAADASAFAAICRELGVKCVMIELARGAHRSQPMTSSHHTGELRDIAPQIEAIHARLIAAGFTVTRVKLEADVTNEGVPVDAPGEPGTYFEFHAKLQLPASITDEALAALRDLCVANGAHLSRNDFERDAAGATRFVTLRVYDAGRDRASAHFGRLVETLIAAGQRIAATKAEYTIYDSRVELDAGWLP